MGKELVLNDAGEIRRTIEDALQKVKDNPLPDATGSMSPKELMERGYTLPIAAVITIIATASSGTSILVGLSFADVNPLVITVMIPALSVIGTLLLSTLDSLSNEYKFFGRLTTRVLRRKHYQREHQKHSPVNFKEQEANHYKASREAAAALNPILEEVNRHDPLQTLSFRGGKIVAETIASDSLSAMMLADFVTRKGLQSVKAIGPTKQLNSENLAIQ